MRPALILIVFWLLPSGVTAAPKADLWARWMDHDPDATSQVDHSSWDNFLSRYVSGSPNGINRIAYAKVSKADHENLQSYIYSLSDTAPSTFNRLEQRAYWINLYNALTVKVVLDHYPITTIRKINISPGLFSAGPWGKKLAQVEGEKLSLDDIEHRILRPIWKDARIHYALNCASKGCPNLQTRAFTAANAEVMLEKGAKEFINHPRGATVKDRRLIVSSIYDWFKEDFGDSDQGVIDHLKIYANPGLKEKLEVITEIDDDDYDWSLNE